MELIQMQAFVSLAQTQHMPRTAQEMNTSQSHISKLISSLEAELGMKLFNRVGRGVVLNEHGHIFYEYASNALQTVRNGETALKSLRGSVIGTVRIGNYAFASVLHPCVRAFSEKNPEVDFFFSEVQQSDANILMNTTDLVLAGAHGDSYPLRAYFPVYRDLLEEEFYAVLSPKLIPYPADKKSIRLEELKPYPLIEVADSPFYQNWLFQGQNVKQLRELFGTTFRVGYMVNDFYAKVSLLDQGVGFSFFPQVCLKPALRFAPDLQIFRIEGHATARRVLAARKQREQMTPAARAFWDFLLEYYHLDPDAGED